MKLLIWLRYNALSEGYRTETSGLLLIGAIMWTFRWTKAIDIKVLLFFSGARRWTFFFLSNFGFHREMSSMAFNSPFPHVNVANSFAVWAALIKPPQTEISR